MINLAHQQTQSGACPVDHAQYSKQYAALNDGPAPLPIEQDEFGVWHVHGYAEAEAVLRSDAVRQAGFRAELLDKMPSHINPPILYLEGKPHHEQRRQTARFFTPRTTDSQYREMMHHYADELVRDFARRKRADLTALSMKMAVRVASQVVGLTDSRLPGIDRRVNRFVRRRGDENGRLAQLQKYVQTQLNLLMFFLLDIHPAIKVRRQTRREDVISHLLDCDYKNIEIVTECITYGVAGMATTREFIVVALWHILENPEYRTLMLTADQETRYAFLHELLRLEPVVGHLLRRTTAELPIESGGQTITIPAGALIDLHVYGVNTDEQVVGERPSEVCPGRETVDRKPKVGGYVMSFGDGAHRCPGAYIAIQESDIFLCRLLQLEGLRIEKPPTITYNDTVKGYEFSNFIVAVD